MAAGSERKEPCSRLAFAPAAELVFMAPTPKSVVVGTCPPERAMNGERDGGGGVTCPDGWLDHHVDSSVAVSRRRHCWRGAVGFLGVIGPFGFS